MRSVSATTASSTPSTHISEVSPSNADYLALLGDIKQRVRQAQYAVLRAVNTALIGMYWDIGRLIVERQQGATWGKAIVAQLARDLLTEIRPPISGA